MEDLSVPLWMLKTTLTHQPNHQSSKAVKSQQTQSTGFESILDKLKNFTRDHANSVPVNQCSPIQNQVASKPKDQNWLQNVSSPSGSNTSNTNQFCPIKDAKTLECKEQLLQPDLSEKNGWADLYI